MIQIGLIGLGYWGPNILRVLSSEQNVNVKYICDISESVLNKYKDNFLCTNNYHDILADKEIDMVFIVTPISTHFKIISDCINANKHIFVEKPLCKTMTEMEIIYSKCREHNVKIFCDYIFLYSNKIHCLKNIIMENMDNILYIEMNRETFGIFAHDNVIYDLLPHDISILNLLFDSEINITHVDKVYNDTLFIKSIINFSVNNINGIINLSWLNDTKERKIKVFCKNKIIEYSDICDNIKIFNYHLHVKPTHIEQKKLFSEEIVNINKEEPLRSSIIAAIRMIESNSNHIFEENEKTSRNIIKCFEKIV